MIIWLLYNNVVFVYYLLYSATLLPHLYCRAVTRLARENEYVGYGYYNFTPEQDGREIQCRSTVETYEMEPLVTTARLQIIGKYDWKSVESHKLTNIPSVV